MDKWDKEFKQIEFDYAKDEFSRNLNDSGISDVANEIGDKAVSAAWGLTKFAFKWGTPIGWICTYAKHKEKQERAEREYRQRQEEERRRREEEERRRREEEERRIRLMHEAAHRKWVIKQIILTVLLFILVGLACACFLGYLDVSLLFSWLFNS